MQLKSEKKNLESVAQLLSATLIVTALFVAREVFIPLALAILLSFLLSPMVNRIQRIGISNVWAVLTTGLFVFVLLTGILTFVGRELSNLVSDIPGYRTELVAKARELAGLRSGMGDGLGDLAKEVTAAIDIATPTTEENTDGMLKIDPKPGTSSTDQEDDLTRTSSRSKNESTQARHDGSSPISPIYISDVNTESPVISWAGTVGNILGPLGTAGLVTVFVLFLLIYRDDMRDRIIKVVSRSDYVATTEALDETAQRISKYLIAQTVVNVSYGLTIGLGLYIVGLSFAPDGHFPNYALWGALAAMLRFVPYIGPVIAASFPILLSLAVFPGYSVTIAVVALIAVTELTSNNILEPWLYGTSTGLSSVAIIFSAVFWGWLWGPIGLLLSTPLTVCLVVIGRYVPSFRIFSTLLGEKVDISPALRFYQRLLSNNEIRAVELLRTFNSDNNPLTSIDAVLAPALKRIQIDQDQERLSSQEAATIYSLVEQVITQIEWAKITPTRDGAPSAEATNVSSADAEATDKRVTSQSSAQALVGTKLKVVCLSSHHAAEEQILRLFAQANPEFNISVIDNSCLPDQSVAETLVQSPSVVLVYVLPPGGFVQARYLCRTLRSQGFKETIVVCCSCRFRNFDRHYVKLRKAGANYLTTGLSQTSHTLNGFKAANSAPQPTVEASQWLAKVS